ncbi:MAG TPA: amidohydrolase family protein [Gemmatimonadaceae bacterium]|nr:amidohydrolase family protein [Gemmatimonadaceae bacterium]
MSRHPRDHRVAASLALAALATAACVAGGAAREQPSARRQASARAELALRAGRILDPVAGRYDESVVILVRGGRISGVIPAREYRADLADSVVDLSQLTVLPGLIDSHVHLVLGGAVASNAVADLRAGFTTVVDLGARTHRLLQLRDSINAGHLPGPRVLAAGIWVGVKGGVCEFNGIGIAGGAEEFRTRIRSNAVAGAEIAKLCLSGWPGQAFAEPASSELPDDVIRASVAEARSHGLVTVAHAISLGSVRAALDAGVDGLAHAAYVDSVTSLRMRDQRMFMVSTLATLTRGDSSIAARSLVSALSLAARNGVSIVFGTDGGVLPHGRNAEELRALVDAGLTPLEAIRAATVNAARAFRIQDSIGTLEPGKVADLVAVAGDPLADIGTLARPLLVVSRGRIVRDDRTGSPGQQ